MFSLQLLENTEGGSFVYIYSFRSSHQKYSLKKGVPKNSVKFLRTPFLQKTPKNCFFLLLSSDNLLTDQEKIDLCDIRSLFQIYQLSFLNKKLIEVFVYILN